MRSHFASSIAYNLFKLYKEKFSNDLIYLRKISIDLEDSFRKSVTRMFKSVGTHLHNRSNYLIFYYIDYMIIYNDDKNILNKIYSEIKSKSIN